MELNVKKQKVFELLGREENKNLSTEEWLNKLNGEGLNVSRGTFFRYKKEFTQLQSSEELKFENGDSCELHHIAKVVHVENQAVKEEPSTPKENDIDIWKYEVGGELFNKMGEDVKPPFNNKEELWKYIDEVDKREEEEEAKTNSLKKEEVKEKTPEPMEYNGKDLTSDEREQLNILLDAMKTCRTVFDAMECCRQLDAFVQNKKKRIGKYVKEKVSTLYKWQQLLFTNYGLDKRICFDE